MWGDDNGAREIGVFEVEGLEVGEREESERECSEVGDKRDEAEVNGVIKACLGAGNMGEGAWVLVGEPVGEEGGVGERGLEGE